MLNRYEIGSSYIDMNPKERLPPVGVKVTLMLFTDTGPCLVDVIRESYTSGYDSKKLYYRLLNNKDKEHHQLAKLINPQTNEVEFERHPWVYSTTLDRVRHANFIV